MAPHQSHLLLNPEMGKFNVTYFPTEASEIFFMVSVPHTSADIGHLYQTWSVKRKLIFMPFPPLWCTGILPHMLWRVECRNLASSLLTITVIRWIFIILVGEPFFPCLGWTSMSFFSLLNFPHTLWKRKDLLVGVSFQELSTPWVANAYSSFLSLRKGVGAFSNGVPSTEASFPPQMDTLSDFLCGPYASHPWE